MPLLPGDEILYRCNETELLNMARAQGLPIIKRGIPREELVAIVAGAVEPRPEHLSPTNETRALLEAFIMQNWNQIRSQLPGCDGQCRIYPCTEGKHVSCFLPNADLLS